MEWLIGIFTLLGVILGLGYSEYRNRQERSERFRVRTFDKRLETHQSAYYWCQKLNKVLNEGDEATIHDTAKQAREWWDGNCLFLDTSSRTKMVKLINLSHAYAKGLRSGQEYVWSALIEAMKAIVVGIGAEYLPEMSEKPEELQDEM